MVGIAFPVLRAYLADVAKGRGPMRQTRSSMEDTDSARVWADLTICTISIGRNIKEEESLSHLPLNKIAAVKEGLQDSSPLRDSSQVSPYENDRVPVCALPNNLSGEQSSFE